MKKLDINTKVYDLEAREYVNAGVSIVLTDEQAEQIEKAFKGGLNNFQRYGIADKNEDASTLTTPLADRDRYSFMFGIGIVEGDKYTCGITNI